LATALAVSFFAMPSVAASATAAAETGLPNLSSAAASEASAASAAATTSKSDTTGSGTTGASSSGATSTDSVVSITASLPTSTEVGATGLPTLSGGVSIVTPVVPDTSNAPFMQQSSLPEGTVFIVVGAFLGFLAMSVLLWRGLVSLSLRRSVKNAGKHNPTDQKPFFKEPAPPKFYNYADRGSSLSIAGIGKGGKRHSKAPTNPASTSTTNLFFSPTSVAGAGINSQPGHRGSNYLPAGYYAAGAAAAANGQSTTQIGGNNHNSISLSNLVPQAQGYSRTRSMGPSPPDSPHFGPAPHTRSSSTLNLSQNPGEVRAPSAYLEDLFDGESGRESVAPVAPRHSTHYGGRNPNPGRF